MFRRKSDLCLTQNEILRSADGAQSGGSGNFKKFSPETIDSTIFPCVVVAAASEKSRRRSCLCQIGHSLLPGRLAVILLLSVIALWILPSQGTFASELFPDQSQDSLEIDSPLEPDSVVVRIAKDYWHTADRIAEERGYVNEGPIGTLEGYFIFKHVNSQDRQKREAVHALHHDDRIEYYAPEVAKKRVKRDMIDGRVEMSRDPTPDVQHPWPDPLYSQQWYLHHGAQGGFGMNVQGAWDMGYTGRGIVVSILDDGIQGAHPDLAENYDPKASKDINDKDDDPTPRDNGDNKHGTRCAGEVSSVAGNGFCGVGVAYHSKIGGVRMLDGSVTDGVEAASLSLNPQHIDIYSASWGPEDDGKTFDGPGPAAKEAFYNGIKKGRGGLGNIFIWASGNGGAHADSCSCDGYTTSIYTLSVSSATHNNQKPWYSEECPSSLATTYSSGQMGQPAIVTADMPNTCTLSHTGTSASAPLAAGVVALALEANRNLTWRDMQHLVLRTSNPTPLLHNEGWITNGVGRKVSNKFGYGVMDATELVKLAKKWKTVPQQLVCTFDYQMPSPIPISLRGRFSNNYTLAVAGCPSPHTVNYIEQVHCILTIQFSRRGDLKLTLISPAGTRSVLLPPRPGDVNRSGFHKWAFLSVQQWGEDPRGVWTLIIENVGGVENYGSFHDWALTFYGTESPPPIDVEAGAGLGGESDRRPPTGTPLAQTTENSNYNSVDNLGSNGATVAGGSSTQVVTDGCDPECSDVGCTERHSASHCVDCRHYKLWKRNRSGLKCIAECPSGYYPVSLPGSPAAPPGQTGECRRCLNHCLSCSGPDACDSCDSGLLLVQAPDATNLHHGRCLEHCPAGFILGVSDPNTCIWNTTLKTQTPTFNAGECHDSCLVCRGPSPKDCLRCNEGYRNESGSCRVDPGYVSPSARNGKGINLTAVSVILCLSAVFLFLAVFGCLMYKDRFYERNARSYAYKPIVSKGSSEIHNGLLQRPKIHGEICISSDEGMSEDDDDVVYDAEIDRV